MHNFIWRIYKLYTDVDGMTRDEANKHCQSLFQNFNRQLVTPNNSVFVIANREGVNDLKIITTYFNELTKKYYNIEA